jgi:hypothetical protein
MSRGRKKDIRTDPGRLEREFFEKTGVRVYLDDIIVFSKTRQDHLALLDKVFERMLAAGMKMALQM